TCTSPGKGRRVSVSFAKRHSGRAARGLEGWRGRLLRNYIRKGGSTEGRVLAVPFARTSWNTTPLRRQEVLHRRWQGALPGHNLAAEWRSSGPGLSDLPDHRPRDQSVSQRYSDATDRRAAGAVPGTSR